MYRVSIVVQSATDEESSEASTYQSIKCEQPTLEAAAEWVRTVGAHFAEGGPSIEELEHIDEVGGF